MVDSAGELLERIASTPYGECESEWLEILRLLRLDAAYIPAIQQLLRENRWRGKPNPIAYIRKGTVRCAVRLGILDVRFRSHEVLASDLNYVNMHGKQVLHDEKLDLALANYEDKFGSRYDDYEGSPLDRVSGGLLDSEDGLDWDKAAELAGLDCGERIVLEIRLLGLGREHAFALCASAEDKKYLQAAWKRFDRHQDALRAALLSGIEQRSRRISRQEPDRELAFRNTQNGSLEIFFQKLVPD